MVPPVRRESPGRLPPRVARQIPATARLPKSIAEDCVAAFEGSVARVGVLQTFGASLVSAGIVGTIAAVNAPQRVVRQNVVIFPSTLPEVTFNERREDELSVINAAHYLDTA